jgi:hypothetical protein
MAQVIVSVQMVYEERVIGRFNVQPLAAVGYEGIVSISIVKVKILIIYDLYV